MDGGSTFDEQKLVEKLAKLNCSKNCIHSLSHWFISHRMKAKQVVETWARQFHCSPKDQRLAFIYLANDVLQRSRENGPEFVVQFWKVLPGALRDVVENGKEVEKKAAERMIGIWEERKVFCIQGKVLKEELLGRNLEKSNRDGGTSRKKLQQSDGRNMVEKIVLSYKNVYDGPVDEEALLSKCRKAISFVDRVDKEIGCDYSSGKFDKSVQAELQEHYRILRESIEQLAAAESSRTNLVSHLRNALQEQELKLNQVRVQLQAAQTRSEQAENICKQSIICNSGNLQTEQRLKETSTVTDIPSRFTPETPVANGDEKEDTSRSAAAVVAVEFAASTSSVEMLSFVCNSLASEDGNSNQQNHPSPTIEFSSAKRIKLENATPSNIQSQQPAPEHLSSCPHPESLQHNAAVTSEQSVPQQKPPSPHQNLSSSSSPLALPPTRLPQSQFMQSSAASMTSAPNSFEMSIPQQPLAQSPMIGYAVAGMPSDQSSKFCHEFRPSEGGFRRFRNQSSVPASSAISQQ
ncbi:hypothetical protein MKW94_025204 [Papaver nudicaule]|uniref:CID domain-containing protein n=1 Tax=Papaver nudicaule TaxID=74823 RepID=A0AA41VPV9_PAPNU|nr:hypothetical protein [Papaver nudicaule]